MLLLSIAFTCGPNCVDRCYSVRTEVYFEDSLDLFHSVWNLEHSQDVFHSVQAHGKQDSLYFFLDLDPGLEQSSFVFKYHNRPNDTIVILHNYKVEYNDRCEDYIFQLYSAHLVTNSFGSDLIFHSGAQCLSAELYLH